MKCGTRGLAAPGPSRWYRFVPRPTCDHLPPTTDRWAPRLDGSDSGRAPAFAAETESTSVGSTWDVDVVPPPPSNHEWRRHFVCLFSCQMSIVTCRPTAVDALLKPISQLRFDYHTTTIRSYDCDEKLTCSFFACVELEAGARDTS